MDRRCVSFQPSSSYPFPVRLARCLREYSWGVEPAWPAPDRRLWLPGGHVPGQMAPVCFASWGQDLIQRHAVLLGTGPSGAAAGLGPCLGGHTSSQTADKTSYNVMRRWLGADRTVLLPGMAPTSGNPVNSRIADKTLATWCGGGGAKAGIPPGAYSHCLQLDRRDDRASAMNRIDPLDGTSLLPPEPAAGNLTPDDRAPDHRAPGDPTPGNPTPGDPTPGDAAPGDPTPADHTPDEPTAPDLTDPDLAAAVRLLSRASVLVVGDVMLDRYIYGQVTRISPEAPVPILSVEREIAYPGGAGNVVRNLTALGVAVALVSVVGDDQAGSDLTGLVGGQPGVEPWLLVQGGRTTTMKTRLVAGGHHLLRTDREVTTPIHPTLAERMISIATDAMAATGITVLSDYQKGLLAGDVATKLIAAAHAAGRKVIVDPKGPDYRHYAGADIIIPNRRDLGEATALPVDDEARVIVAAQALRAQHGFGAVLVTEGSAGMTLVDAFTARHFPAEAADVYDVSGAGDTVTAVLAAGIAVKLDLKLAVRLANVAAGIVVGKVGTAVAREADLLAALSPQGGTLRKVMGRQAVLEQVSRWRHQGYRIGFTNGCFDMMHPGHVHLLDTARDACERLVVGLNDDASTRRLKGPTRPVQQQAVRAAVLAGLPSVDLVTVFDEDTPEALIEALRPDVLVKGADYTLDGVLGAEQMRSWGGRVLLAALLPGQTTPAGPERARAIG